MCIYIHIYIYVFLNLYIQYSSLASYLDGQYLPSFKDGVISGQMPVVQPATCADGSFTTGVGSTYQNKVRGRIGWVSRTIFFLMERFNSYIQIDSTFLGGGTI